MNTTECRLDILSSLGRLARELNSNTVTFEKAQEEITKLEAQFKANPGAEGFHELILRTGLIDWDFIYEGCVLPNIPQLVHPSLSTSNLDLFKYRDSAKLKILGKLHHDIFNHLFVNRSRTFTGNRYVDSKQEINNQIAIYKDNLCRELAQALGISELTNARFFTREGAVMNGNHYNYHLLMTHPEVQNLAADKDIILDNPFDVSTMQPSKRFNAFSILYILNNFDNLIMDELSFLLHTNERAVGTLNNTTYIQEDVNDQLDAYSIDEHEWAGTKNYVSNMAKFTISQIPKVKVIGNNQYAPIEGSFLTENDIFILAHTIKSAEREYQLLFPEDNLDLNSDSISAFRKLFKNRAKLPSFKYCRQELIHAIEAFLYSGDSENLPIAPMFKEAAVNNPKVTDFESLLIYECLQAYAPNYYELSGDGVLSDRNYGGVYEGGNSLTNNLVEFVFGQLMSQTSILGNNENQNIQIILNQALNLMDQDASVLAALNSRDNQLCISYLANVLKEKINDTLKNKTNLLNEDGELDPIKTYAKASDLVTSIVKNAQSTAYYALALSNIPKAKDIYKSIPQVFKNFIYAYKRIVSERPIIQLNSTVGTTIPVYRLGSAITNDVHFINTYKNTHVTYNGKLIPGLNILADNPHLLSSYDDTASVTKNSNVNTENEASINKLYKDSTAYVLNVGDIAKAISYHEMTPSDQMLITFLMQIQGIEKLNQLLFQPVCYSDKSSIGFKCLNLEAIFPDISAISKSAKIKLGKLINLKTQTTALGVSTKNQEESIRSILLRDYHYRKNKMTELLNDILIKWKTLNPNLDVNPLSQEKLIEVTGQGTDTNVLPQLITEYEKLKTFLESLSSNDLDLYRTAASYMNIDLVDELDYVMTKDNNKQVIITINPSIWLDALEVSSPEKFRAVAEKEWNNYSDSKEFTDFISQLTQTLKKVIFDKDNFLYKTFINDGTEDKYFKIEWVPNPSKPGKNKAEIKIILDENGVPVLYSALRVLHHASNFMRDNYLDLVSKKHYLDPNKALGSLLATHSDSYETLARMDRGKRTEAMSKRMVLYPATIQQFIQGKIDGVSREIKVAAVSDPQEKTWNIQGDTHGQDIYDGSGTISPFTSWMEDASIVGHGIQGTKKTLGTSTSKHNSSLFKWAEFIITNEKMRFSQGNKYDLHKLFKKMHDLKWDEDIDVTQSWTNIVLSELSLNGKKLYTREGFNYYRLDYLIKEPDKNTYTLYRTPVELKNGVVSESAEIPEMIPVKIESIYDLYNVLGGLNSVEISGNEFSDSENSLKATHEFIIYSGEMLDAKSGEITQENIRQPLRDKFISIVVNKSAVKRGIANLNSAKDAWESDIPLNSFSVNTTCFGIQLDANHHSDLADVREMSQTISALAALGRTADLAQQAYDSIADLVKQSITDLNKSLKKINEGKIDQAIRAISEKIIASLAKSGTTTSTQAFIDMFVEENDQELSYLLPISDEVFYKDFVKEILANLNKSAIRRRYSGLGGILNPASNIMQLYTVNGQWLLYPELQKKALAYLSRIPGFIEYFNKNVPKNTPNLDQLITRAYLKAFNAETELMHLAQAELATNDAFLIKTTKFFKENPHLTKDYSTYTDALLTQYLLYKGWTNPENQNEGSYFAYLLDNKENSHATKTFISTKQNPLSVYDVLKEVGILDTVLVNGEERKLTTNEEFTKFKDALDKNSDASGYLNKNFVVSLLLDKPRDLRPQQIMWVSEKDGVVNTDTIYTTPEAQLYKAVNSKKRGISDVSDLMRVLTTKANTTEQLCKI